MSTSSTYSIPTTIRAHASSYIDLIGAAVKNQEDVAHSRILCNVIETPTPSCVFLRKPTNSGEPSPASLMTLFAPIVVPGLKTTQYMSALPVWARLQWASFYVTNPRMARSIPSDTLWGMACVISSVRAGIYAFLKEVPMENDDTWGYLLSLGHYSGSNAIVLNVNNYTLSPLADAYCAARVRAPIVTRKIHAFLDRVAVMGPEMLRLALVAYSGKSISASVDLGLASLITSIRSYATDGTVKKLDLMNSAVWEACMTSCVGGYPVEFLKEIAYDPLFSVSVSSRHRSDYTAHVDKVGSELLSQMIQEEPTRITSTSRNSATATASVATFASFDEPVLEHSSLLTEENLTELRASVAAVVPAPGPPTNVMVEWEEKFAGF